MELALAVALALASVAAVAGWTRRAEERARAHRLADEVHALRRASFGRQMTEGDTTGSTPSLPSLPMPPDAEPAEWVPDPRLAEARRLLERAEEALREAEARPHGVTPPPDALRNEALELLSLLERVELSFSPLRERCGSLLGGHTPPELAPPPAAPAAFDLAPVERGLRSVEDLSDATARLRDDLGSLARSTERLREATSVFSEALSAVARGAEAIAPMAGALSGVANRVNLLALNLGVLVSPGARQGNVEEAGAELRSIFEEARRLAREVGAVGQRLAAAARGASERGADLSSAIAEERGRVERGLAGLGALDDLSDRLETAFEGVRRAAQECDETRARLRAEAAFAVAQAEGFAADVAADRRAASAFTADLLAGIASLTEARIAAERTVRSLLAAAEAAGERRGGGAEAAAGDALRDALRALTPTVP